MARNSGTNSTFYTYIHSDVLSSRTHLDRDGRCLVNDGHRGAIELICWCDSASAHLVNLAIAAAAINWMRLNFEFIIWYIYILHGYYRRFVFGRCNIEYIYGVVDVCMCQLDGLHLIWGSRLESLEVRPLRLRCFYWDRIVIIHVEFGRSGNVSFTNQK